MLLVDADQSQPANGSEHGGARADDHPRLSRADPLVLPLFQRVNVKLALGFAFALAGGFGAIAAMMRARTLLFSVGWVFALGFALWFGWSHWVSLSHHWTQRDQFWRYYELRKPGEPIAAFLMNWRGETFYSRNTVKQIRENRRMAEYADQPGREWSLVEHHRLRVAGAHGAIRSGQ